MNYQISKENNKQPLYIQLYNYLKIDILNGVFSYGKKLPSKRVISENTHLSIITVEKALSLLEEEGYIEPKEKSGYFVIFHKDNKYINRTNETSIPALAIEVSEKHDETPLFPITSIAKAARKVLLDYPNEILKKSPNKGDLRLRTEISNYLYRSRGIKVDINRIIISAGAEHLYSLISQLFPNNLTIGIEDPSYSKIYDVYNSFNKKIIKLPLYKDGIDMNDLYKNDIDILHCTPFHSYPSGISISSSKKHAYLEWSKQDKKRIIIEDNYDSELTVSCRRSEDSLFMLSEDDNVIYINTFSKTIAPSFRVGYLVLPNKLIHIFDEKLGFYSCTVSRFTQLIIAELLNNGSYERHINNTRREKRNGIKLF